MGLPPAATRARGRGLDGGLRGGLLQDEAAEARKTS